ncbi:pentapeptide repeat-containing protein [Streptomyces sp. SID335]|nr:MULTISPECIES: pentapeptide repeat-containing protein [unclassified Streptomyces]MYY87047.1 pentapeptide repeat-containing protein [Streptomyces sp. SID335]NDZ89532.1 pentapeptide repeat-containing protein [Streptomyces sp. SID10115]NEA01504.1 pentapeptide repeat-containing protein [Streptomyces sp. SID10116]NEB49685.1 pentapeptide repeat-containing protein [Streptomyces sp. SID339]
MMPSLIRRRRERPGLRLWPVGLVLASAFVLAVLVAAAVFAAGWDLLGARELRPERRLDSKTLFDLVKLSFGVVAGAGALVALVVAYRRQRVDEDGALREATRLHTERFTTAVSQLGSESAAVRLGGVHALAGLADDAPTALLRQTCIDVLSAYLRLPYTAEADLPADDMAARHTYLALREVRHTVIRLIRDRTAIGPEETHVSWRGHDFDFTGVVFDGGDFSDAEFVGGTVHFTGAVFADGRVDFSGVRFSGVDFSGAQFSGGGVDFVNAVFADGQVDFSGARFSGARVNFVDARFSGGTVSFSFARFSGGTVDFSGAAFSDGTVDFTRAAFDTEVHFTDAEFSGGTVHFTGAEFSGGTVDYTAAEFSTSGTVSFAAAHFRGGLVDLSSAMGRAPDDLLPPQGRPLPPGLRVPPQWRSPTP